MKSSGLAERVFDEEIGEDDPLPAPAPADIDFPERREVAALGRHVKAVLERRGRIPAMSKALDGAAELLKNPSDPMRFKLRQSVFARFSLTGIASYQINDFECFDYDLFDIADDLPSFRGPKPRRRFLESGEFFCVLGAAQTFGRLVAKPYGALMSEALDLPVLNLSRAGVGPELFLDERLMALIKRARFVVLQVMSGRSAGCPDYPGGRRVDLEDGGKKRRRTEILEEIWNEDRKTAIHYVRRWNVIYCDLYKRIRELLDRPVLLLWFSERAPNGWWPGMLKDKLSWGAFPQLVGAELHGQLCELFGEHHEVVTGRTRESLVSRATGKPCPYFGDNGTSLHFENTYYPSSSSHAAVANALLPWARDALARG